MPLLLRTLVVIAACIGCVGGASAKDGGEKDGGDDGGAAGPAASTPSIYLDMKTSYVSIPAGALPIGLGNTALSTALQSFVLSNGTTALPRSSGASLPAVQAVVTDLPMTIDVTDGVSLYAGVSASSTSTPLTGWSTPAITSWNIGFQADLYQQKGGPIPTITWQPTITQSVPNDTPLATTIFTNILEFDYAFDKDETRGLLAGMQDTRVSLNSPLASVHPSIIGYAGGYYQWSNNWKLTGRVGLQSFGGATLLNFMPVQPLTQPVVRFDLDRMDDNDNRLFGLMLEIMWVPKPSYQLTLRTPLYFVRNQ